MKNIEEMTAEEALSEWKRLNGEMNADFSSGDPDNSMDYWDGQMAPYGARLDQLVEESGIYLHDGAFVYSDITSGMPMLFGGLRMVIPAMEQQAIQNWLLRKAGLK